MTKSMKQNGIRLMSLVLMIVMLLSMMIPVSAENASADTDVDPDNYVSELTGERVIDGVGDQTGVRYQPAGYTWDPEVDPEVIDDVEYYTYDINGLEDNDLGMQMMIACNPEKAIAIEEGIYYESEEELQAAVDEVEEKLAEINPEEDETVISSLMDTIFPKAEAVSLSSVGIDNYTVYSEEDSNPWYFSTCPKKITFSGGDANISSSWAFCCSPSYEVPETLSAFKDATVYKDVTGAYATVARIIYYGVDAGYSYCEVDAAAVNAGKNLSDLYNMSDHPTDPDRHANTLIPAFYEVSSRAQELYNRCATGDFSKDGYIYSLVRLNASASNEQNVVAVYRREEEVKEAKFRIRKKDIDGGGNLAGAKFKIEYNGKTEITGATNPDGYTDKTIPLESGDIGKPATVTEIEAPANYQLDTTPQTIPKLEKDGFYELTYTDKIQPIKLKLKKVDQETSYPLEGAKFKLEWNGKVDYTDFTDANGETHKTINITSDDVGKTITITECHAPNGYVLDESFSITREIVAGETYDLIKEAFTDKEQRGEVSIYKTGDVFDHFEKVSDNEYRGVYTTQKIKGCVFEIYAKNKICKADGTVVYNAGDLVKTVTTDADGVAVAEELRLGTYIIREIAAPAGYMLAEDREVTIEYGDPKVEVVEMSTDIHNKCVSGDMSLIKVDKNVSEANRPKLAGAVLKILQDQDGKKVEIGSLTTDANGTIKLTNFPIGKYYYQETKAPTGYLCDNTQKEFEIYLGKDNTPLKLEAEVDNYPAKAKIEILKKGQDKENYKITGSDGVYNTTYQEIPVKGCKFNLVAKEDIYSGGILRAKAGDIIAKYTTDSNGKGVTASYSFRKEGCTLDATAKDLTSLSNILQTERTDDAYIGKYQLIETEVPKEFELLKDPIDVEIKYNSDDQTATFENPAHVFNMLKTNPFEFTKTSLTTGKTIPGVKVNIYDANKNLIATPVTDKNGNFVIKNLAVGKYYYQEYDAPIGFVIDESLFPFEIKEGGEVTKAVMDDESQQVEITLIKNGQDYGDYYVDEEGQTWYKDRFVDGAGFAVVAAQDIKLSDSSTSVLAYKGDIVAHGVTDEDGRITFRDYSYRKGTTAAAGTDLTTLEEGTIQTENAIVGNIAEASILYQLVEEETPDRYRDLETMVNVIIGAGTEHVELQTAAVTAFNYAKQGDFWFTKTDIVTGEPLPNTTITIYKEDGVTEIFTGKTDENGQIKIENLPEGKYYYQEHEAPYGYIIDEGLYEFEITDTEITMAELADKLAMGDPILEKTGEDYDNYTIDKDGYVHFEEKPVAGATFAIVATEDIKQYDGASTYRAAEGDIIAYVVTDENGIGKTNEYYFRDGKTLTEAVVEDVEDAEVEETEGEEVVEGDEAIEALDAEDEAEDVEDEAEEDAEEVEEEEVEPIILPAGTDLTQQTEGVEVFEHVFLGSYKFVEVESPERYLLSEEEYPFTVEYVDMYTEFIEVRVNAFNYTPTGEVIIDKVDVATGEPVPGATITIYDENKTVIFEQVSDSNGQVKIHKLPVGHYYYQETNAPDGYELNEDLFEFEVKENDEIVRCQITNKKIENVETGVSGFGAFPFVAGGIAVITASAVFVIRKRKNG